MIKKGDQVRFRQRNDQSISYFSGTVLSKGIGSITIKDVFGKTKVLDKKTWDYWKA